MRVVLRIILSISLALGGIVASGISKAAASNCPSTWALSLNSPSKTQGILKSLNANPYGWQPDYLEAYDSTGVLKTNLSKYKKNDYSAKLIAEASPDGQTFTDYLPQTYFSYIRITGYKYRYVLEIATVDCPTKHVFYSQPDVIAAEAPISSSFAEAMSDAPFEFRNKTLTRYQECKNYMITQASSGKEIDLKFPYDMWNAPSDWTKTEGCYGLLRDYMGWPSSKGKQIIWEKIVFAPTSGDLCLTMDSRSGGIKTSGNCKVGAFTLTFYHDTETLAAAKPRLLDSFVLPQAVMQKPSVLMSPSPSPTASATQPPLKPVVAATTKPLGVTKTTITCIKGKLTKKVTAVKPKCPTGYKKK